MKYRAFKNPEVESTFDSYPGKVREKLLYIRERIFQLAEESDEIGEIEETLKWENPSYLTYGPKSGTTIRLSELRSDGERYAVFVHCQTSLVSEFKEMYPKLTYDGNRSIIFDINHEMPLETIEHFIYLALTYHYRKKHGIGI